MRPIYIFSILFFQVFCTQLIWGQCPVGFDSVRLEINLDFAYYEENWEITNLDGTEVYGVGTVPDSDTHIFTYCVPANQCVKFTIYDDSFLGDGFFPDGYYRLYVNDALVYSSVVGSFFAIESIKFNCPPGTVCASPIDLTTGVWVTPTSDETWFSFTPVDTGNYMFSSCGAACSTKIWVYDKCEGIFLSENQLGTIAYSEDGCPDSSAAIQLNLEGGKEYIIRLRYQTVGCSLEPIPYTFTYLGPVIGCTDTLACNYEPLATVNSGLCIYPGDPNCLKAPDFLINQEVLLSSLKFEDKDNADLCLVEAGCMRGFGTRHIISFASHITNIGDADYYIGKPPTDINEPSTQFVYDPCHQHWHYIGYADYLLYDSDGYRVPIGSKTGFCVLDAFCFGVARKYKCDNMGISVNCGDVYGPETPCQWIDITDIPPGDYTMVVRINWDKSPDKLGRIEKRYDNNWAQACFSLVYDGNTPDVVFSDTICQLYTDCLGEVFGNAQPDCNGVCNGPALIGDWNQDTIRNSTDVAAYLTAALTDNGTATPCNDLFADNQTDVFDAALLQECNLHSNDPQYWVQRFPCQFPAGFLNTQDLVTIQPVSIDTLAKTFDIAIANPYNRVMAYEFSVSGLVIASVENLATEHQVIPMFNPATGEILALAIDESSIQKNPIPTTFLRVHYSKLTDHMVCVSEITAVVNNKYQKSNAIIGDPSCLPVTFVAVVEPALAPFAVFVQPNPMLESTTVFFENKNAEPMTFSLTDLTGRTLRSFSNLRSESVKIERNGLPEGTYLFTLRGDRGSVTGKIVIR